MPLKKTKCHKNRPKSDLAIRVNATEIIKKDKNKTKDLSYIECYYTWKPKDYHANKCLKKQKN